MIFIVDSFDCGIISLHVIILKCAILNCIHNI